MAEALDIIIDAISDDWTSSNTDGIVPTIGKIYDQPSRDTGMVKAFVSLYTRTTSPEDAQVGSANQHETENISINILTGVSRSCAIKLLKEVKRILKANMKLNDADAHYVRPGMITDHSDKRRKLWEFTMEATVKRFNV